MTKKGLVSWYIDRGKITAKGYIDDMTDIINRLTEDKTPFVHNELENKSGQMVVLPRRCKVPAKLFFMRRECYKIIY